MKDARHISPNAWTRLAAAARRHASVSTGAGLPEAAPPGFSTRVVALSELRPQSGFFGGVAFERLAARALGCACACALAMSAWEGLSTTAEARALETDVATVDYVDPVGAILEVVHSS